MRSTAIVKVARERCGCPYIAAAHLRYVARCKDCGWTSTRHLRVILDGPGTGLVQQHRLACPAMTREGTA